MYFVLGVYSVLYCICRMILAGIRFFKRYFVNSVKWSGRYLHQALHAMWRLCDRNSEWLSAGQLQAQDSTELGTCSSQAACSLFSVNEYSIMAARTLSSRETWTHSSTCLTWSKYLLEAGACSRSACGRRCSRRTLRIAAMCKWDASWLHCMRQRKGRCGARRSLGSSLCAAPDTEACALSTLIT